MDTTDLRDLVRHRKARDAAKREFEEQDRIFKEIQNKVFSAMQDEGLKTMKVEIEGAGTIQFQARSTAYGRVIDMDTAIKSFEALGVDDFMLKPGVEKRRLNEMVRSHLERGEPLPEGIDFYTTDYIAIGGINE